MSSFNRGSASGYKCSNCRLDASKVNGIDIYVLFQEGPFKVNILSITALDAVPSPPPSIVAKLDSSADILSLATNTVRRAGGVYDQSYTEISAAVYGASASVIAGAKAATALSRAAACAGLKRAGEVGASTTDR